MAVDTPRDCIRSQANVFTLMEENRASIDARLIRLIIVFGLVDFFLSRIVLRGAFYVPGSEFFQQLFEWLGIFGKLIFNFVCVLLLVWLGRLALQWSRSKKQRLLAISLATLLGVEAMLFAGIDLPLHQLVFGGLTATLMWVLLGSRISSSSVGYAERTGLVCVGAAISFSLFVGWMQTASQMFGAEILSARTITTLYGIGEALILAAAIAFFLVPAISFSSDGKERRKIIDRKSACIATAIVLPLAAVLIFGGPVISVFAMTALGMTMQFPVVLYLFAAWALIHAVVKARGQGAYSFAYGLVSLFLAGYGLQLSQQYFFLILGCALLGHAVHSVREAPPISDKR